MVKIIVSGACGRMGSRIIALSKEYRELKLIGALEHEEHKDMGRDIGETIGIGHLGVNLLSNMKEIKERADVLIDFSNPQATLKHIRTAVEMDTAMVIGTTGFNKEELMEIESHTQRIPCVLAPNMSIGINLILKIIKDISRLLGDDYDIEIIEAHHRLKKDAPSGTALKLAETIAEALNRNLDEVGVYTRKGLIGERKRKEIGIQTIRAGDIVGEHTVLFGGLGERIEITHRASSRDTFARGALRAAIWIAGQRPGLYDMQDVIGLR